MSRSSLRFQLNLATRAVALILIASAKQGKAVIGVKEPDDRIEPNPDSSVIRTVQAHNVEELPISHALCGASLGIAVVRATSSKLRCTPSRIRTRQTFAYRSSSISMPVSPPRRRPRWYAVSASSSYWPITAAKACFAF